jgi:hypothetical protein
MEFIQEAYIDQMVGRFSPVGADEADNRRSWYSILLAGEPLLRIPAILALFALPTVMRRPELWALPALLTIFVIMAALASGHVSPRYSLLFLPMMTAALAAVTLELLSTRPAWTSLAAIAVLSVLSLGPVKTPDALGLYDTSKVRADAMLKEIGSVLKPDETLISCRGARDGLRIYPGAVSYFASQGRPFVQVREIPEIVILQNEGRIAPPYRGICHATASEAIKGAFGPGSIVSEADGLVHWQASTPAR